MTNSNSSSKYLKRQIVDGVIRQLDAVSRVLKVLSAGRLKVVDVPSDCSIVLNGESVKLRLLQPGDHVRITYLYENSVITAQCIEAGIVRPLNTNGCCLQIGGENGHE